MEIRRCHHVKVNGEQCGSPALRGKCYCYFNYRFHHLGAYGVKPRGPRNASAALFPVLEDGNSIQAAVMQVVRLILAKEIDNKEAGLLLYALQIASRNLDHLKATPWHDTIVVDPLLVKYSRIGGKPAREEHFKIETEEAQKKRNELEDQISQSQRQADAEWEEEARREFASSTLRNPEADKEQPPARPVQSALAPVGSAATGSGLDVFPVQACFGLVGVAMEQREIPTLRAKDARRMGHPLPKEHKVPRLRFAPLGMPMSG